MIQGTALVQAASKLGLQAGAAVLLKGASTAGARAGAQVLRPQAPSFVSSSPAIAQHVRTSTSAAVAEAPVAPSVSPPSETCSTPSTPSFKGVNSFPFQMKFIMPNAALGPLLIRNGQRIKELGARHGAAVQAARYGTSSTNLRERLVTIAGDDAETCKVVLRSMLELLKSEDVLGQLARQGAPFYMRQVIPTACAGKVLGPAGDQIAAINAATGANVIVESKPLNAAFIPFRVINYSTQDMPTFLVAIGMVVDLLQQDEKYAEAIRELTSVSFRIIPIPASKAGAVMGPAGSHIKSLQEVLRVKIGISDAKEHSGRPVMKYAAVWGYTDNVNVACDVIAVATGGSVMGARQRPGQGESTGRSRSEHGDGRDRDDTQASEAEL